MGIPAVLIVTGYGLNCEAESALAWERAGAAPQKRHLHDVFDHPEILRDFQALMWIGGFSYGDHMGSGHVLAQRVRHRLQEELARFVEAGKLVLGVCNGFQVMAKIGLVPGLDGERFRQTISVMHNDCGTFQDRWVHLCFDPDSPCVFTRGLENLPLPIRHGEGKVFTTDRSLLDRLEAGRLVPCRYADPDSGQPTMSFPHNPNGSLNAIAGLCDPTGRVFGLMPHPEAYLFPENHPQSDFQRLEGSLPGEGLGLALFRNAVHFLR